VKIPWTDDLQVLEYLKRRIPLYHRSNVFFRDIQFGVQAMVKDSKQKATYAEAENLARELIGRFEQKNILRRIDGQTWMLEYEQYRTPVTGRAAAPKPALAPAAAGAPPQGS
jgi:hypothetical protein